MRLCFCSDLLQAAAPRGICRDVVGPRNTTIEQSLTGLVTTVLEAVGSSQSIAFSEQSPIVTSDCVVLYVIIFCWCYGLLDACCRRVAIRVSQSVSELRCSWRVSSRGRVLTETGITWIRSSSPCCSTAGRSFCYAAQTICVTDSIGRHRLPVGTIVSIVIGSDC